MSLIARMMVAKEILKGVRYHQAMCISLQHLP